MPKQFAAYGTLQVSSLIEQTWRAAVLFDRFTAFAKSIGVTVIHDEMICHTKKQERQMAKWWEENA